MIWVEVSKDHLAKPKVMCRETGMSRSAPLLLLIDRAQLVPHYSVRVEPVEVEGLAKPMAARIMSLARGGQTLITRSAFDLARRGVVGSDDAPDNTKWMAHGPYVLKGQYLGVPEVPAFLQGLGQPTRLRRGDQPVVPVVHNHKAGPEVAHMGAGRDGLHVGAKFGR